ncbi:hypothetical protein SBOR_2385 [Sclerotinia borealis F-4128]|uniref:C2H2-type domain-containing protein n=1 Tax=Sclerotinia borealis (strain F-4128) TaxID=1432307 RepID=W9CRU4_SCLBF|nr:hypothetical protein SBOR_2385 [Sclerotinia borealis F-4128]
MAYCHPCDRYFASERSYDQHIENSSAHYVESSSDEYSSSDEELQFECDGCYDLLWSLDARENHHVFAHSDRYCIPCERMFGNENNLMQHQHSKVHMGTSIKCPFCPTNYPTASALIIHLESGSCPSGMNRARINAEIRRLDSNHIITSRLLEYPSSNTPSIATQRSWNGQYYECYLCSRQCTTLQALNQHLQSPAHEQKVYHCPEWSEKWNWQHGRQNDPELREAGWEISMSTVLGQMGMAHSPLFPAASALLSLFLHTHRLSADITVAAISTVPPAF